MLSHKWCCHILTFLALLKFIFKLSLKKEFSNSSLVELDQS